MQGIGAFSPNYHHVDDDSQTPNLTNDAKPPAGGSVSSSRDDLHVPLTGNGMDYFGLTIGFGGATCFCETTALPGGSGSGAAGATGED
jgi:hypothetical protein